MLLKSRRSLPLYQAHFVLAHIQCQGISYLCNEFTAMGYHPDGFTLRDKFSGDNSNDMGLAGAGGHLHHHRTKRLKSLLYSVDHIRLMCNTNGRQDLYCLPWILDVIRRPPFLRTSSPAHYCPCGKPSSCIQADFHSDSTKTESGGVHPQGSCRAVSYTIC